MSLKKPSPRCDKTRGLRGSGTSFGGYPERMYASGAIKKRTLQLFLLEGNTISIVTRGLTSPLFVLAAEAGMAQTSTFMETSGITVGAMRSFLTTMVCKAMYSHAGCTVCPNVDCAMMIKKSEKRSHVCCVRFYKYIKASGGSGTSSGVNHRKDVCIRCYRKEDSSIILARGKYHKHCNKGSNTC